MRLCEFTSMSPRLRDRCPSNNRVQKVVWLNWMLDFRPTVNSMPEKVAQFVETFRRQFNIAKPCDVAIQAFGSNNFDVRIARRFRQATDTRNYAPHSRVTETLTKQVVTEIAGTTDLVKRTIEIAGLHKAMAPALCLDNKYTGGS